MSNKRKTIKHKYIIEKKMFNLFVPIVVYFINYCFRKRSKMWQNELIIAF